MKFLTQPAPLALDFRIHRVNQSLDVTIPESERLKFPWIVRMTRHMIRADRAGKLRVPQNSDHLEKIHVSFIRIHFREIVKSSTDVAHMDLSFFSSSTKVWDKGEIFSRRFLYPFPRRSETQLESVVRAVDDCFVS